MDTTRLNFQPTTSGYDWIVPKTAVLRNARFERDLRQTIRPPRTAVLFPLTGPASGPRQRPGITRYTGHPRARAGPPDSIGITRVAPTHQPENPTAIRHRYGEPWRVMSVDGLHRFDESPQVVEIFPVGSLHSHRHDGGGQLGEA